LVRSQKEKNLQQQQQQQMFNAELPEGWSWVEGKLVENTIQIKNSVVGDNVTLGPLTVLHYCTVGDNWEVSTWLAANSAIGDSPIKDVAAFRKAIKLKKTQIRRRLKREGTLEQYTPDLLELKNKVLCRPKAKRQKVEAAPNASIKEH
jgi:NDP-sugar pyrophosphorylase family protein